jgi:RNA polymerase sigma-70 factor (ECF subfamily)
MGDKAGREGDWLERFHRGDMDVLESCYRETFSIVQRTVGEMRGYADRESVIHEVFSRLLSQPAFRQKFRGGSFPAWLTVVARHQAIDYARKVRREVSLSAVTANLPSLRSEGEAAEARLLVDKFRRTWLEPSWGSVFEACFVQQMSQREAAQSLGLSRTTIAYRELRIRHQLRSFLRGEEGP